MSFFKLKNSNLKRIFSKLLILSISLFLVLIFLNFILIKISKKQNIPRPLASSLTNYLFTYYPDTYEKLTMNNYTAILGDSNAMGAGDAYLNNNYNFSIAHFLHKETKKNYLTFARAGYGSISAVSNYIKLRNLENYILFKKSIGNPEEILFFFYEGNDLEENLKELETNEKKFKDLFQYVEYKIKKKSKIEIVDFLDANFPVLNFVKFFNYHLMKFGNDIMNAENYNQILENFTKRVQKIRGKNIILDNKELLENKIQNFWTNKTIDNKIKNIRPIESAAADLNDKQKDKSLKIFFESILYLKNWENNTLIKIIYLPSPATTYYWNSPIRYYPRYSKKNLNFKEITTSKNLHNSNFLRNKIRSFSEKNNFEFIDLTEKIQKKGKDRPLHGPVDWVHFNSVGYKFISQNIK